MKKKKKTYENDQLRAILCNHQNILATHSQGFW